MGAGDGVVPDVRTQGQYQSMDKRFIGLIFSVFNEDKLSKVRGKGTKALPGRASIGPAGPGA